MHAMHRWFAAALSAAVLLGIAGAAPAAGQDGEIFDDWTVRCSESPQNAAVGGCVILQGVINNETQQPVMQIAIGFLPDSQDPAAIITLPLGVRLPPGVLIQIDEGEPAKLPFERCLPEGCKVQFRLGQEKIAAFKAGVGGRIAFQNAAGKSVTLPFSLKGFTKALASIQ